MANTPNILLPEISEGQAQKEVAYNTAMSYLDDLVAGYLSLDVSGPSSVTLTEAQARHAVIRLTGTISANLNIVVPSREHHWVIGNATSGAYTITVKTASGTGITVTAGYAALCICDGTNVFNFAWQ